MSNYSYIAVDPRGAEKHGTLEVSDQAEALRRIKQMGLFPTRILCITTPALCRTRWPNRRAVGRFNLEFSIPWFSGRVKPSQLTVLTRQLATLVEAGLPLLRSLRILEEQQENRALKRTLADLGAQVENGSSFTEAVSAHPKVFNSLYVNMVRAGEIGGALETTLTRVAEFMEKAQKLKGKVKSAMFYPGAVLLVAVVIVGILMGFVVPRFKLVFDGLLNGTPLPTFTLVLFGISEQLAHHMPVVVSALLVVAGMFAAALRTVWGRRSVDQFKLTAPVLGSLFRKAAISRFASTLGTLLSNGVPILQALTIVKDTCGNVQVGRLVAAVHEQVKQGDAIAPTLKSSSLFPAMVAGMVDVGEQTGALPEMLRKIADTYDDEVDNAATALTSLLEPLMIVFLAVVVGSIVIAMFLPLIGLIDRGFDSSPRNSGEE